MQVLIFLLLAVMLLALLVGFAIVLIYRHRLMALYRRFMGVSGTTNDNKINNFNDFFKENMVHSQERLAELERLKSAPSTIIKNDELSTLDLDLKIARMPVNINLTMDKTNINLDTLNTVFDVEISSNPMVKILVNGVEVASDGAFKIDKISHNTTIKLEIFYKTCKRTYFLNTLHSSFPKYLSTGESAADGYIYSNVHNFKFIFKLDKFGNVIFYKRTKHNSHDFKPTIIDGKIYYSYYDERTENLLLYGNWGGESDFVVLDEKFNEIDRIGEIAPNIYPEFHDSIIFELGHYLISSYVPKYPTNIANYDDITPLVIASVIYEIKEGKAKIIFDSTNFPIFYNISYLFPGTNTPYAPPSANSYACVDYVHFNTMFLVEEGVLLLGFRQISTIIKYDYKKGEILWVLGGDADEFGLREDQKFCFQHYQIINPDGRLTLFDNGNNKNLSRILEFRLDEIKKAVLEFKAYSVGGRFSVAGGCTQKLGDGRFAIGWGLFVGKHLSKYSEINFNTKTIEYEFFLDHKDGTYRCVKYPI